MKKNDELFYPIIGYEKEKNVLVRILDVINNQEKYKDLGVNIPHGLLLYGQPGVGKSTLAKAFIKATKRNVFTIRKNKSDGEFINTMNEVFREAKDNVPSIILLDDMDKFSNADRFSANAEEYVAVQAMIDEVRDYNIFIIATANDIRTLPDSLKRAGRFDNVIEMFNPKKDEAVEIIKFYLEGKKVSKDVDATKIAAMLDGRNCAELEKVINEAGIYAGIKNKSVIEMDDIIKACLSILYDNPSLELDESNNYPLDVAYHEAGHALIAELLESGSVSFISVSNKNNTSCTKGLTIYNSSDEYFNDIIYMENRIKSLLAGKAATEIAYCKTDTGVNSDLNRAFRIAYRFVDDYCKYGFNSHEWNLDKASYELKSNAEHKEEMVIAMFYEEVKLLLFKNKNVLDEIAKELNKKGVLFSDDVRRIIGKKRLAEAKN